MNIRELYESLLDGNRITLSFSSRADYISVYAQLRNIKSIQDAKMKSVSGLTISEGKVIKTVKLPNEYEKIGRENEYQFSLGERKVISKIEYQIVDIVPESEAVADGIPDS